MSKRIALVHAVKPAMQPIADAFQKLWPEADCANILDDSLSRDREKTAELTPAMYARFEALRIYATDIGSDALLFTCSAFGEAIEAVAQKSAFPVLKPNEAMFEAALERGRSIGMLATFEPSVASMEREFYALAEARGVKAEIRTICVPAAMEALNKGDAATHNALLAEAAPQLKNTDAVLLAQFSTSQAEKAVSAVIANPVLTSPASAVRKLRSVLGS
ncbi:MAG: aspartate/glutamate racemase family protein [Pseudomonadota bacterium]